MSRQIFVMIAINKAKRILGKESDNLSNEQIEDILSSMYSLAESFYSLNEYDKNKGNGRKN